MRERVEPGPQREQRLRQLEQLLEQAYRRLHRRWRSAEDVRVDGGIGKPVDIAQDGLRLDTCLEGAFVGFDLLAYRTAFLGVFESASFERFGLGCGLAICAAMLADADAVGSSEEEVEVSSSSS